MELLNKIQQGLKVKKSKFNKFGKFNYRHCEDILEAVKPLLGSATLKLEDEIIIVGEWIYVRATATLADGDKSVSVSANAREPESMAGMSSPQVTGAASSYARKYALGGLFCLDDANDADDGDNDVTAGPPPPSKKAEKVMQEICNKMIGYVPEGLILVDKRVDAALYAQSGRYPEDINKAGSIASWLIGILNNSDTWHTVTKKAGV